MGNKINNELPKIDRKAFLIDCATTKANEANAIIDNASKQCSNLKMLFLTLGVPASISLFAIYYNVDKEHRIIDLMLFPWISFVLYLILLVLSGALYYSFYLRQSRYRKVKESIERLKENLFVEIDAVNVALTSENFTIYYKAINAIAKKTTSNKKTFLNALLDSFQITIPLALIAIFWLVVAILHCCGVSLL